MRGPYSLTMSEVEGKVDPNAIGYYVLGYMNKDGLFRSLYVGRSGKERLQKRLKGWVGDNRYKQFLFDYADSEKQAYDYECIVYHELGEKEKLDNERHPRCPDDTNLRCPVCGNNYRG